MKLNPDCVRDILLEVEKSSTYSQGLHLDIDKNPAMLEKYSWDEIAYHIKQCALAGLIQSELTFENDRYSEIGDITPKGHEFLANIRQDNIWHKTKDFGKKLGVTSLKALTDIAAKIVTEIISAQFK